LLLFLVFLLYSPVYFVRMRICRREPLYLAERLGLRLPPRNTGPPLIWIHAVSVGEVLSLRGLLAELKESHPDWRIYFSSLTNSGYRVAKEKLSGADSVFLVPLDFAWIVRRFFSVIRPDILVLAESEFWPNLLRVGKARSRAVILINGRISLRSFRNHRRWRLLSRKFLANIDIFLVQTPGDKERLAAIGVPADRIKTAGNLKAEVNLPLFDPAELEAKKKKLGLSGDKKVIVAGSTHRGEEDLLLGGLRESKRVRNDVLLIIAPRHPERSDEIEKIAGGLGFRVARRTSLDATAPWDVLILDTIGELASFYALADLTFVGGSLIPHGGQNLLEPAFYAKPIFFGPHMDNFAPLAAEFVRSRAAAIVSSPAEIAEAFRMTDEVALREMGQRARKLLESLRGATEKTIIEIEMRMPSTGTP
jgi:3-deoxy-D-manno-octulosonic-acid transferase